jgi:hypothetical protein
LIICLFTFNSSDFVIFKTLPSFLSFFFNVRQKLIKKLKKNNYLSIKFTTAGLFLTTILSFIFCLSSLYKDLERSSLGTLVKANYSLKTK